jgi:hypothetical protein
MTAKMRKRSLSKRSPKKRARKKRTVIPAKQWDMPAGLHANGVEHATLRDVLDPDKPTMQLSDLTIQQRAELVVKRLELQPSIELAMVGAGMIDKTRAINEVKKKTQVGKLLIEIEHQMIANLIEQAKKHARRPAAPRRNLPNRIPFGS